jgi:general secretion pathway protein D
VATAETVLRRDSPPSGGSGASAGITTASGDGVTLSIDGRSNSLIFYTTGPRYEALLPMIRRLDIPPKQIVLEAMIAEVTLTGEFSNGVEFAFRDGKLAGGTAGGLGLPSGGLALTYDAGIVDQIRLRLQASDARVNVLSSPILVVKDGVGATIQVGNDVPTVGATAADPIQSDRIVTTVLYRKTGLNLSITPNINAEGSVLLTINQSTTSTVPGSSGVSGAPIFFQRSVTTEVVAGSGQTVFLAGLRSESDSSTTARIPVLGSVPLVGKLFSSDTRRREKTELVILITPRIVGELGEWTDIMKGLSNSLRLLNLPQDVDASRPGSRGV